MEENGQQPEQTQEEKSKIKLSLRKYAKFQDWAREQDKRIIAVVSSVKFFLGVLIAVFLISACSAVYIIFSGKFTNAPAKAVSGTRTDKAAKKQKYKTGTVKIVKINGVIQESGIESIFGERNRSASAIARNIRSLAEEKETIALLLDINSPGGTVASVQDIYESLMYFKSKGKPVVALFRDVAASGGFYVAMAADRIVAQPGTITGSIGVIMQTNNFEGLFNKIGVKFIPIKSGKHKDIGASYRPMTPEETALLQEMIDDTYQQFYHVVKIGRPNVEESALKTYTDGRVFTGAQAKAIGLIDDLGGQEKAKEYLKQLTGIEDIRFDIIRNRGGLLAFLFSDIDGKLNLGSAVEELTTPKVSYLWTY
ncbi:MAG: signal peptide peptidase SppA [Endomicrobia bacterium]|nr:signal peptide peptidase SppA [Endomicrobiia bacterium]MCL2800014.1 signal peptide peptidase SppA [Endomicrobiia bacterium]